jgi:hypothetical protein
MTRFKEKDLWSEFNVNLTKETQTKECQSIKGRK